MSSSLPESGGSTLPSPTSVDRDPLAPAPVLAVVFDLGNVLIEWDAYAAISTVVGDERARGFLADETFDFHAWNMQQDAGRAWEDAEADAIARHPHYREEILAYREHFEASLVGPIEGTVDILRELHAAGTPLFALTNWSHELFPVALARFDFLQLFEDIVISGEEGIAKPDPEIFEVLAERLEHIGDLEETIFIDDRLDNVQAAVLAGMDAVQFTSPSDLRADLLFRGLPVKAI
ncbi:HAD family phosphatase [Allobranchiibius sp. GilTou38]|uniref:HAD family hydrolase n=1 Tax=Allobranchiibius sp. GilTou38 TaxID=2815210 RepID=UPI001AA0BE11|nr:HAD family phosphatase [Allobranchiibius sp. GilTou38]MBO1766255.1 HAD family phosphatase [Allobranchiibius sp. GilTou38]